MIRIIDANIILRLLRQDGGTLFLKSKKIFESASAGKTTLYVDEVIVAEVIWSLTKFYGESPTNISRALLDLCNQDWIINPRKKIVLTALKLFADERVSYIDCWIYSMSKELGYPLETFDRKLKKLTG